MNKYLAFITLSIQNSLQYRTTFIIRQLRSLIHFIVMYFLWLALIPVGTVLFGYGQSQILTYVLAGIVVQQVVFATQTGGVAERINSGEISNYLVRPMSYFRANAAVDMGDKILALGFAVIEFAIFFVILKPPFFFQTDPIRLFLTGIFIIIATTLLFFTNMLLGCIGFWSNETWAPQFIFTVLLQYLSGWTFPLDILPKKIFDVFMLTPFPYLLFVPIKIYLGTFSYAQIFLYFAIALLWLFAMYILAKSVWKQGLKSYTAQGR